MADPKEIYRGFVAEETRAAQARSRARGPLAVYYAWQQAIAAGEYGRFGDVVDVQGYTENCLGLTGWTTGFEIALKNFGRNMQEPFADLTYAVEEVVEGETACVLRMRVEATHVRDYLGIPGTGRRIAWDNVSIVHTGDGKVVGMWSQPDLYATFQQIK